MIIILTLYLPFPERPLSLFVCVCYKSTKEWHFFERSNDGFKKDKIFFLKRREWRRNRLVRVAANYSIRQQSVYDPYFNHVDMFCVTHALRLRWILGCARASRSLTNLDRHSLTQK